MIRIEDVGEVGYGAIFAGCSWWDNKRMKETTNPLKQEEVFKKASFWAFVGIGLPATLISSLNWMPRQNKWFEHMSHGFLFYLPSFILDTAKSLGTPASGITHSSAAIAEANRIIQTRRALAPGAMGAGAYVAPEHAYQVT